MALPVSCRASASIFQQPSSISATPTPGIDPRIRSTRKIQAGETLTYGEIAARLGDPVQAREVGQSLGRNPWPIIVPCHRVTAANGKTGGFSAHGGVTTKLRLLAIESAHATSALPLFAAGSGAPGTPSR